VGPPAVAALPVAVAACLGGDSSCTSGCLLLERKNAGASWDGDFRPSASPPLTGSLISEEGPPAGWVVWVWRRVPGLHSRSQSAAFRVALLVGGGRSSPGLWPCSAARPDAAAGVLPLWVSQMLNGMLAFLVLPQATGNAAAREIHYSKVENKEASNLAEVRRVAWRPGGARTADIMVGLKI
jgi:hypothetical protein